MVSNALFVGIRDEYVVVSIEPSRTIQNKATSESTTIGISVHTYQVNVVDTVPARTNTTLLLPVVVNFLQ